MVKVHESGLIGRDGKLRLPMDRLQEVFSAHPGTRVVATFEIAPHGTSEIQRAYYRNYIVPTIVEALWKEGTRTSGEATDAWLVSQYPGEIPDDVEKAEQMDGELFQKFLEWLKQFAAEHFHVYVEDPKSI